MALKTPVKRNEDTGNRRYQEHSLSRLAELMACGNFSYYDDALNRPLAQPADT